MPNPQTGGPPTVGCPRLLIQHIRSYPPYLEAVSSIRNPRTRHAMVTVDPHQTIQIKQLFYCVSVSVNYVTNTKTCFLIV
jgi:hypothetical protein